MDVIGVGIACITERKKFTEDLSQDYTDLGTYINRLRNNVLLLFDMISIWIVLIYPC